jgi:ketosteroid isomerase-like protein
MTSTQDLRDTVRRYFAAVDANDFDRVLELFDDNVIYERPGYDPIEGKERLKRFFTSERVIANGAHDIQGVLAEGDRVSAWGEFEGTSRTGTQLREGWCDIYEFRDARIFRRRTYFFRPAV